MTARLAPLAILVLVGAGWGLTVPLAKIAVSGGHRHFGILFWELAVATTVLGAVNALRGRPLPMRGRNLALYALIAAIGSILPGAASFQAAVHLPAGIIAILNASVPLVSLPMAVALGTDRPDAARLCGLALGVAGVAMLVAPATGLPSPATAVFVPLALLAPLFYALEGNVLARWGSDGLDPIQLLCGASLMGLPATAGLALATGSWMMPLPPATAADRAVLAAALIHAVVYGVYVRLVSRAGAVFAAQVAYLIAAFGVLWAMILLGERPTAWAWAALAALFAGLALVQPRPGARTPCRDPAA